MHTDTKIKHDLHFFGWKNVPDGYCTKTKLNKDYGVKPIDMDLPDATAKVIVGGKWKVLYLYHIDNTKEINKRKVILLEATHANIAESLYIINKSAKKSRDTKQVNYDKRSFRVVQASKTRQNRLYDLKDAVLDKLVKNGCVYVLGYHKQHSMYNNNVNYLRLLGIEGYTFHVPIREQDVLDLEYLGEIGVVPAEAKRQTVIGFFEAELLLKTYIGENG